MQDPRLWQPDMATNECTSCGRMFGLFQLRRRHHCRRCGCVVCETCSKQHLWLRFRASYRGGGEVSGVEEDEEVNVAAVQSLICVLSPTSHIRSPVEPPSPLPPPSRETSMWADGFDPVVGPREHDLRHSPAATHAPLLCADSPLSKVGGTSTPRQTAAAASLTGLPPASTTASCTSSPLLQACKARSQASAFDTANSQWWLLARVCDPCVRSFRAAVLSAQSGYEESGERESFATTTPLSPQPHAAPHHDVHVDGDDVISDMVGRPSAIRAMPDFLNRGEGLARVDSPVMAASHGYASETQSDRRLSECLSRVEGGFTVRAWLADVRWPRDGRAPFMAVTPHHSSSVNSSSASWLPRASPSSSAHARTGLAESEMEFPSGNDTERSLSRSSSPHSFSLYSPGTAREEGARPAVPVSRGGPVCPPYRSPSSGHRSPRLTHSAVSLTPTPRSPVVVASGAEKPANSPSRLQAQKQPCPTLLTGLSALNVPPFLLRMPTDASPNAATETTRAAGGGGNASPASSSSRSTAAAAAEASRHHTALQAAVARFATTINPSVPVLIASGDAEVEMFRRCALQLRKVCIVVIDERCVMPMPATQRGEHAPGAGLGGDGKQNALQTCGTWPAFPSQASERSSSQRRQSSAFVSSDASPVPLSISLSGATAARSASAVMTGVGVSGLTHSAQNTAVKDLCMLTEALQPFAMPTTVLARLGPNASQRGGVPTVASASGEARVRRGSVLRQSTTSSLRRLDIVYTLDSESDDVVASQPVSPHQHTTRSDRSINSQANKQTHTSSRSNSRSTHAAEATPAVSGSGSPSIKTSLPAFDPWSLAQQQQRQNAQSSQQRSTCGLTSLSLNQSVTHGAGVEERDGVGSGSWSSARSPTSPASMVFPDGSVEAAALVSSSSVAPLVLPVPLGDEQIGNVHAAASGAGGPHAGHETVFRSAMNMGELLMDVPVLVMASGRETAQTATPVHDGREASTCASAGVTGRTDVATRCQWHAVVAVHMHGVRAGSRTGSGGASDGHVRTAQSPLVRTPVSRAMATPSVATSGGHPSSGAHLRRRPSVSALMVAGDAVVAGGTAAGPETAGIPPTALGLHSRMHTSARQAVVSPPYMKALKRHLTRTVASVGGVVILVLRNESNPVCARHGSDLAQAKSGHTQHSARVTPEARPAAPVAASAYSALSPETSCVSLDSPGGSLGGRRASARGFATATAATTSTTFSPTMGAPSLAGHTHVDDDAVFFSGKELGEIYQHLLEVGGKTTVPVAVVDTWSPPPSTHIAGETQSPVAVKEVVTDHAPGSPLHFCDASLSPSWQGTTSDGGGGGGVESNAFSTAPSTVASSHGPQSPRCTSSSSRLSVPAMAAMENLRRTCRSMAIWYARDANGAAACAGPNEGTMSQKSPSLKLLGTAVSVVATATVIEQTEQPKQ